MSRPGKMEGSRGEERGGQGEGSKRRGAARGERRSGGKGRREACWRRQLRCLCGRISPWEGSAFAEGRRSGGSEGAAEQGSSLCGGPPERRARRSGGGRRAQILIWNLPLAISEARAFMKRQCSRWLLPAGLGAETSSNLPSEQTSWCSPEGWNRSPNSSSVMIIKAASLAKAQSLIFFSGCEMNGETSTPLLLTVFSQNRFLAFNSCSL